MLRRNTWFIALLQAGLIFSSLMVAWLLCFDFSLPSRTLLFVAAPILISIRLTAVGLFGLFHGWWRYTGVSDLGDIIKSVTVGSAVFFSTMYLLLGVTGFPRPVYVLEPILTVGLLAGIRLVSRSVFESTQLDCRSFRRVAIVGAGAAAQMILRELRQSNSGYMAVACVDDDPSKRGLKLQGVPVMGSIDGLPALVTKHPVDEILIAIPSATASQMRRFVAICQRTGTKFRTAPALRELISGEVTVNQLRTVNLDDLLGREPAKIDLRTVGANVQGRTVLVTGAAGSIGRELCNQLVQHDPATLLCVDRNETGMFHLQEAFTKLNTGAKIVHIVADVGSHEEMNPIFQEYRPEVVFHAAAYKHVPVMQANPRQAIKNNVFALLNLLAVAKVNGCEAFVSISSDKAVQPRSVMGATKRVGELILSCWPADGMRCVSVRFGNVLGSSGSVVLLLQEQIRDGNELTITHPDVCRFFMTVHEAVSLVLQAFVIGNHGEILVLDMDRPIRIVELAKTLVRLSGKSVDEIKVRFTGLRPGEKLCEELFYTGERISATTCPKIRRARGESIGWAYLESQLQDLQECIATGNAGAIRTKLMSIVSTGFYRPSLLPAPSAQTEIAPPFPVRSNVGGN